MNYVTDRSGLGYWGEKEGRMEAAHLLDQVDAVFNEGSKQVTPFLSFALRDWLESVLRKEQLAFLAAGGFPEAERIRMIIGPRGESLNAQEADITLLWVEALDRRTPLEHRQILGSLMGLGLKRDVLGDIQAGKNGQYIATTAEIASFLLDHWKQAGRELIKVSLYREIPDVYPDLGEERRVTVNSSRLDALISNAFGVSRSQAQEWIMQGKVKRDGIVLSKPDTGMQTGDLISCRGQGRLKLLEDSRTRKERTAWQIVLFRSRRH